METADYVLRTVLKSLDMESPSTKAALRSNCILLKTSVSRPRGAARARVHDCRCLAQGELRKISALLVAEPSLLVDGLPVD
jgi:hypothetical protein